MDKKNKNVGIIQEQGDYGIFTALNNTDQKIYSESVNSLKNTKKSYSNKEQIRLGDCNHLNRKD